MSLRGRRNQQRYQVYVKMGTDWSPMTRFNQISHALNWITQYDPDATVMMKIKDNETCRFISLDEAYGMVPKKIFIKEDDNVKWKQEGF